VRVTFQSRRPISDVDSDIRDVDRERSPVIFCESIGPFEGRVAKVWAP
jgi:hypothetical protein